MFDSIARTQRPPRRRQVASLVISLSVNSGIVWLVAVMSSQVVSEVPGQAQAHEVVMVETMPGGSGGARLPEAPEADEPAPPPAVTPPEPEMPPEAAPVVEQTPPPADAVPTGLSASDGAGTGGSGEAGTGGPGNGGPGEGGPGAGGPGDGGTGRGEAVLGQVRPLRVVKPRFPPAALALGLPEVRCVADVRIDARGRPTEVSVDGCPVVYRQAVVDAMGRWRFEPATIDGEAVPARFRQPFRFQLQGG